MTATMKPMTEAAARKVLRDRFSGVLKIGSHAENGEACAMEYLSVLCGKPWTDSPFDSPMDAFCRCLNDSPRWPSPRARAEGMFPLVYWMRCNGAPDAGWVKRVAERTIREIVPIALRAAAKACPKFADDLESAAVRCEEEGTREAAEHGQIMARKAADAADAAFATFAAADAADAAFATFAAAEATAYAAKAKRANAKAAHKVLLLAAKIGLECAQNKPAKKAKRLA